MSDKVYNPYIPPTDINKQPEFNTLINTNISDYSIEDIFNLLDITIDESVIMIILSKKLIQK